MASQGPNSPGTGADDATVGDLTWSNPSNITTSDGSHANTTAGAAANTHYLKATNFGFSVPGGATIDGIVVEIERSYIEAVDTVAYDNEVKVVKSDGTIGTTNKAKVGNWPASDTYETYGGVSDLWGESWTAEDINDVDFGTVLSGYRAGCNLLVDHIRITVYYTESSSGRLTASTRLVASGRLVATGRLTAGARRSV